MKHRLEAERFSEIIFYGDGPADRLPGLADRAAVPAGDRLGDRARDLPRARARAGGAAAGPDAHGPAAEPAGRRADRRSRGVHRRHAGQRGRTGAVDYVGQQLRNQGGPGARFHAAWGWLRVRAPFLPSEQDVIARITASLGSFAQFLAGQATGLLEERRGLRVRAGHHDRRALLPAAGCLRLRASRATHPALRGRAERAPDRRWPTTSCPPASPRRSRSPSSRAPSVE